VDIGVVSSDEGCWRCAMRRTTMSVTTRSAAWLMTLIAWTGAGHAAAAEINVLSAGAVRSVVSTVSETFAKETGNAVKGTFGTVGVVRQKLAAGEPADVIIATDVAIDELARQGAIVPGTRTDI